MSWWTRLTSRRRRTREADLDIELRDHMQRQLDEYIADGMSLDDARRRVRLEFGAVDLAKDECRDVHPLHGLETFVRDVRLGARALSRERVFAISVTLILTVGIGAAVTMFSVLNGIVLRPLPYARPDELVVLSTHAIRQNQFDGTSAANSLDWRRESRAFAGMALYRRTSVSRVVIASADGPQRAQEGLVDPGFFELLGVPSLIGRTFSADDFAHAERVVILSEGLWQSEFGRSKDVVGRTLSIGGADHIVIGVMPRSFQLPTPDTRLWRPLSVMGQWWLNSQHVREADSFEVIGRMAPRVSLEAARTEMTGIAARLRDAYPENRDLDVRVTPLVDHVVGAPTRRGVWLGFGAVMALLAIAGANAGGLLAARASRRRRELAVRAALGAERSRLVRQLLAETASLWFVACSLGLALASGLLRIFANRANGPAGVSLIRMDEIGLDWTTVVVTFACGFVLVAICGSVPALAASKADARDAFRSRESTGSPRHRFQNALVTAQMSGAMTLVICSALLGESWLRVQAEDPGYPSERLLIARIDRPSSPRFFFDARARLKQHPGIMDVGGITDFFIRRAGDQQITVEGRSFADSNGRLPKLVMDSVTPGYFGAMDIKVVAGRDFDERDLEPGASSVVIVSRAVADRFWPNESALGKHLVGGSSPPTDGQWATVVGVVSDMRREGLDVTPILSTFIPLALRSMDMTIRTTASTSLWAGDALIPAIRQELRALDPSLPAPSIVTAEARLGERLGSRRLETQALVIFAVIALVLAAIGLYASLAYQVTMRAREIGVRAALGAGQPAIVGLFVRQGLKLALVGTTVGIAAAVAGSRLLQGFLYETPAVSVRMYLLAATVVLITAGCAAWLPARRASRVSPLAVLREG